MNQPRACHSCSTDSAGEHRVRCARCYGQVHRDCRDVLEVCYTCRWVQARALDIADGLAAPAWGGRAPFVRNLPSTARKGLPVPLVADEHNRDGRSLNEVRILTAAVWSGWRIDGRDDGNVVTLRKHGRGHLRLSVSISGQISHASTQRKYLERLGTRLIKYVEDK
ncbi:hypothetical protein ABZS76_32790 [Streptomyces sp. NPDC005562]|uniref:hypothetical protein n=1 Tax=Streptomyces sp. NPDC005562 TaxID=3154890 RepID=UPI0033B093B7